jgi:hypothetical protein
MFCSRGTDRPFSWSFGNHRIALGHWARCMDEDLQNAKEKVMYFGINASGVIFLKK